MRCLLIVFLISFCLNTFAQDSLVVAYCEAPPFVETVNSVPGGPSIWLNQKVLGDVGLPYQLKKVDFDELLSGLADGSIDLSASPLTITSERLRRMRFTVPYYISHSSMMTPELSTWQRALSFIRSFFSLDFFRALGALGFIILIFGLLVWFFERRANPDEFEPGVKGLWNGFWWSAVTMTTVGYGDKSPRTTGGRIVALIWMFTAIVVISGFTASIASSLTMDQLGSNRTSIDAYKDSPIGVLSNSSTSEWLKGHFYNNLKEYSSLDQALEALRQGDVDAVSDDQPVLHSYIDQKEIEGFSLLPQKFNAQYYAVALNAQLPDSLIEEINLALQKRSESQEWQIVLSEFGLERD